jgi:4-hydroxybutyrate dehydrogenase
MQQFNYPTTILFGEGALQAWALRASKLVRHVLLVTDATLVKLGAAREIESILQGVGIQATLFAETHPNPIESDVESGVSLYLASQCDGLVALGGGSPMDVAKVIRFRVNHDGPLADYDDAKGGDAKITGTLPPLYAIPTTAGTGSEVGRSGVITLRETGKKTIFFHPKLLPDIAILEPRLTVGLPASITAATGIDALIHCLEAYWVNAFHPMADGIALEGIELILKHLPVACRDGKNLESRGAMQLAAAMGATAFQKGLGMIHSLAHPLSARHNTHHGLANALLAPASISFLETAALTETARGKIARIRSLFSQAGYSQSRLSEQVAVFFAEVGIQRGLRGAGIPESDLNRLADDAFADSCHATNMIPVSREDLLSVYQKAY